MRKRAVALIWVAAPLVGLTPVSVAEAGRSALVPVSVTAQRTLGFGDVFPGVNASILLTDPTSGKWLIQGDPNVDVAITFTALPATLSDGPNTIPIVYGGTDAGYHTTDAPASATTFDPAVGAVATLSGTGELYLWIGGTVQPGVSAPAGTHNGTITADAVYN